MYIFEISIKDRLFDTPFNIFKEKKFSSHRRVVCTYSELNVQNASNHSMFIKTVFYKRLRFSLPFQTFMPDIWPSKSLVPTVEANYELRVSRQSHIRDHPNTNTVISLSDQ